MDFKIKVTRQSARQLIEWEYQDAPQALRAAVAEEINKVMNSIESGDKVVYNDYLNLEVTIEDCQHAWVAGMAYVHQEDLREVARQCATYGKTVECEKCGLIYVPEED